MTGKLMLPQAFEPARAFFEQSVQPYIHITLQKDESISRTDSKLFGVPYFPLNMPFPTNKDNRPLKLLAQLNFAQMPNFSYFPTTGILQFFIDPYDDIHGMDFDDGTNQAGFRVIYHEAVEQMMAEQELPTYDESELMMPGVQEVKMHFTQKTQPISLEDFRAQHLPNEVAEQYDAWDDYIKLHYNEPLHQVGGYSFFTQTDPREYEYSDYTVMLLQIDSQMDLDLLWGDVGIANFFVTEEQLKNRDFSRVLYNWDCG
ncbi:YwqG family protein [Caryophanon latum]|uniref:Cytoplasmic protein n=1 Tax=Caryophanon latum TaxID=33977 RepID=A0A1C0YW09_9BACL|nr:YwqG family protein [Caryophanon latum]OCS91353.1 hypothetical protein A6K76_09240 [Caryophanon latum]